MKQHPRRSGLLPALAAALALGFGGCSLAPRTPYTQAEALLAQPPGYHDIRVWLDGEVTNPAGFAPVIPEGQSARYLALSGGGGNGAYGAGILNGWTKSGDRPVFTAVSGVSTGALIAPFAFLGPQYDGTLRDVYTAGDAESLVQTPDVFKAAFGSSLFGSSRLLDLVSKYVDAEIVSAIAREHLAGRRLYVVTTNLDSKRGVVWNIGAIAASGRPDALPLIRQVLAASASVPLAFAPQLIEAQADGHAFQEMHVDGNVTTAVFTLPLQYLAAHRRTRLNGGAIYIIMNTTVEPQFDIVDRSTLPIIGGSINTLITQKTLEDLATTYAYTRTNDVDFNLTAIEPGIAASGPASFDTAYMRKLYALGYETAATGTFWRKAPPAVGNHFAPAAAQAAPVVAARRRLLKAVAKQG